MTYTKEEQAAYNRAYYLKNKKKIIENNKVWCSNNREKRLAYNKTYYLKLNLTNKNVTKRTLKAWGYKIKRIQPKCMTCGSTDNLHAHHILSKHLYPEYALSLLNGITLCEACHISVHSNGEE